MTPTEEKAGRQDTGPEEEGRDWGLPRVDLAQETPTPEALSALPAAFAYQHQILPLRLEAGTLVVAVSDPARLLVWDELALLAGREVRLVLAEEGVLRQALETHYVHRLLAETRGEETESGGEEEEEDPEKLAQASYTIRLVNLLFHQALNERASDIHIEPFANELKVRFRIDGVLHEVPAPPKRLQAAIASRIKIMAGLNIAERRLPQDGRIQLRLAGKELDVRVSTVPTVYGESIVLRLLDRANLLSLTELGLTPQALAVYTRVIQRPYGIILLTGPTGSGKTTALYATLQQIYTPEKKIITIEDPVEYQLDGINQIPVRPKINLTFANGLRSILRQDPDVIMVGEIRDMETASIAIQASLTGHLVFSTLHTNDAAGAVTRLLDMGIDPYLVASSLIMVVAQRLVRVNCPECREEVAAEPAERAALGLDPMAMTPLRLVRGRGCEACRGTGYRGRTGIFEVLVLDEEIRRLILARAPAGAIKQAARAGGMQTLAEDARAKVMAGVTTVAEYLRVTGGLAGDQGESWEGKTRDAV